ncbi:MAG: hypothetical protein HeimC2_33130 [Candidatus Heimdallarchaeota archaeon LC_2]|nr:MAG: hypothetical protein HeimC2_33130 [Candidatus Heimdallarchaeota archaeon LC_2]
MIGHQITQRDKAYPQQLLGISIPISYFFYLIIYQSNAIDVTTAFDDNMGYLGVAVIVGGMLYLFGLFDDRSRFNKLLILITAFALIDSGIQILLAAIDGNPLETLLFTWG